MRIIYIRIEFVYITFRSFWFKGARSRSMCVYIYIYISFSLFFFYTDFFDRPSNKSRGWHKFSRFPGQSAHRVPRDYYLLHFRNLSKNIIITSFVRYKLYYNIIIYYKTREEKKYTRNVFIMLNAIAIRYKIL